jgi:hypothetical protein
MNFTLRKCNDNLKMEGGVMARNGTQFISLGEAAIEEVMSALLKESYEHPERAAAIRAKIRDAKDLQSQWPKNTTRVLRELGKEK